MKTIISLLFIGSCLSCFAQENKMDFFPEMSRGAGISFQKFDGLNNRIANFPQYKQIRNATGVLQLGWFKESHQFISQINFMGGSSMSGDRDMGSRASERAGGIDGVPIGRLAGGRSSAGSADGRRS